MEPSDKGKKFKTKFTEALVSRGAIGTCVDEYDTEIGLRLLKVDFFHSTFWILKRDLKEVE